MTTFSSRAIWGDIDDDDRGDPLVAPVDVIDFDPCGEYDDVDATTVKLFFVARPSVNMTC